MKRIFLILLVIVFASIANAADTTHFVTKGCTFNGNGTSASCAASNGAAGAWNTCQAMITGEVAAGANLTTRGGNLIIEFATTGGAADTAQCTVSGFTGVDATHLLRLQSTGANRHSGVWDPSKYRLSGHANGGMISVGAIPYIEIDGLQGEEIGGSGSGSYGFIRIGNTVTVSEKITGCLARQTGTDSGGGMELIFVWPGSTANKLIYVNNIVYMETSISTGGPEQALINLRGSDGGSGEVVIAYSNLCYSNVASGHSCFQFGGNGASDSRYLKDNIAQGAVQGYGISSSFSTDTHVTNISADTSSPDSALRSKTITFVSITNGAEDFHLGNADAIARDAGTDLSADAQFSFNTDIDGTTRPINSIWDIGPDEAAAVISGSAVPSLVGGGLI